MSEKFSYYKILAGKLFQKQGEIRKEFGVGDIIKISDSDAKRMGTRKVEKIADAEGNPISEKVKQSAGKKVIPAQRTPEKVLRRIKKSEPSPPKEKTNEDEDVKELSDDEVYELMDYKGGGYYILSDGTTKVRGKAKAITAQRKLL